MPLAMKLISISLFHEMEEKELHVVVQYGIWVELGYTVPITLTRNYNYNDIWQVTPQRYRGL